ncbi:hypothetical protein C4559_01860 [Candidatus Microgenomates bacterium]|nr:MAG: hypothetical protein C4559_01860 [Candidatus Microgenomates bacterium]
MLEKRGVLPDHLKPFLKLSPEKLAVLHRDLVFPDKTALISEFIPFDNATFDNARPTAEAVQRLKQSVEFALDLDPNCLSYGLFIPSYIKMFRADEGDCLKHRSLLVGALSIDSVAEYKATIEKLYPLSNCLTIDIEGKETAKFQGFCFADGLKTPFLKDSFGSVYTNMLLNSLKHSEETKTLAGEKFFKEMYRIIKPKGDLLMVEGNLDSIYGPGDPNPILTLRNGLLAAGFAEVDIEPALSFKKRGHIYEFFENPHLNPSHVMLYPDKFAIKARK